MLTLNINGYEITLGTSSIVAASSVLYFLIGSLGFARRYVAKEMEYRESTTRMSQSSLRQMATEATLLGIFWPLILSFKTICNVGILLGKAIARLGRPFIFRKADYEVAKAKRKAYNEYYG